MGPLDKKVLNAIVLVLKRYRGVDFSGYREKFLRRCLEKRMAAMEIGTPENYVRLLDCMPQEMDRFLNLLLVRVSKFHRNPLVFEVLSHRLLPELLNRKRHQRKSEIRIWSAGCGTGEEPYSVALLIRECPEEEMHRWRFHLFATDINSNSLRKARHGIFDENAIENVKYRQIRDHFTKIAQGFQLSESIMKMVCFSEDDLIDERRIAPAESIYGGFDLILCRNVLIYYELVQQNRIFRKLIRALNPLGFLVLGETETPPSGMTSVLHPWDDRCRIYQKQET